MSQQLQSELELLIRQILPDAQNRDEVQRAVLAKLNENAAQATLALLALLKSTNEEVTMCLCLMILFSKLFSHAHTSNHDQTQVRSGAAIALRGLLHGEHPIYATLPADAQTNFKSEVCICFSHCLCALRCVF